MHWLVPHYKTDFGLKDYKDDNVVIFYSVPLLLLTVVISCITSLCTH